MSPIERMTIFVVELVHKSEGLEFISLQGRNFLPGRNIPTGPGANFLPGRNIPTGPAAN
jgi:hypothetical protein